MGLRPGAGTGSESGDASLAGFDAGVGVTPWPVLKSAGSGDTSLAGFAGGRRPHAPGGRIATPAAFR